MEDDRERRVEGDKARRVRVEGSKERRVMVEGGTHVGTHWGCLLSPPAMASG